MAPRAVAAQPGGSTHRIVWNALQNLGAGFNDPVSLRVRATDQASQGDWSEAVAYQIIIPTDNPIATDDAVTTPEDTPLNIPVLANDHAASGRTLSVSSVSQAAHGAITLNPDATVRYSPHTNFFGADSFTYSISDGVGGVASARVTITVNPVNDLPTISAISAQTTQQDTPVGPIAFEISDVDTPASELTLFASSSRPNLLPVGSTKFTGSGSNRAMTLTPGANYVGAAQIAVTVSDGNLSSTTSFLLTITASTPRVVRVVSGNGSTGAAVIVPIEFVAQGNESALGFSLNFTTSQLSYVATVLGSDTSSATLNLITNQLASGRLGIALALPPGQPFVAGTRQIAMLTFTLTAGLAEGTSAPITFGDAPLEREVVAVTTESLLSAYSDGNVTVLGGYESDVSPRPNGNGTLGLGDWVQAGRFYAGLDPLGAGEFQRADSSPRLSAGALSLGDGKIGLGDWVQAGRYYAGLDPLTPAGGSSSSVAPLSPGTGPKVDADRFSLQSTKSDGRGIKVINASGLAGQALNVSVILKAIGNENATAFSLKFDHSRLSLVSLALGADASESQMLVQTNQLSGGYVGVAVSLLPGRTFQSGGRELVRATFSVGAVEGNIALSIGDIPLVREITDAVGGPLNATFGDGTITIGQVQPKLEILLSGNQIVFSWPSSVEGFVLEVTPSLISPIVWSEVSPAPVLVQDRYTITLPTPSSDRFFRLRRP